MWFKSLTHFLSSKPCVLHWLFRRGSQNQTLQSDTLSFKQEDRQYFNRTHYNLNTCPQIYGYYSLSYWREINETQNLYDYSNLKRTMFIKNSSKQGTWVAMVEHLPLAQVMILGSWDQVLHQAPCREPASPSAYVSPPLSVCHE